MHLINKMFDSETIRTVWNREEQKYYISVIDIVGVLSESKDKRKYWNKLKQRLRNEGNESVTNCHQLKLGWQTISYRCRNSATTIPHHPVYSLQEGRTLQTVDGTGCFRPSRPNARSRAQLRAGI